MEVIIGRVLYRYVISRWDCVTGSLSSVVYTMWRRGRSQSCRNRDLKTAHALLLPFSLLVPVWYQAHVIFIDIPIIRRYTSVIRARSTNDVYAYIIIWVKQIVVTRRKYKCIMKDSFSPTSDLSFPNSHYFNIHTYGISMTLNTVFPRYQMLSWTYFYRLVRSLFNV